MHVLGISCYYHDSAAALIRDGELVAAAEEERFTRVKHDTSFPKNAIEYCLKEAGISASELDYVSFYEKPFVKFERVISQHMQCFPRSYKTFLKSMPSWLRQKLRIQSTIRKTGFNGDILFVEHHMSHAAGSFLMSPFEKAAILTVDGVGEWSTTTYGVGEGTSIRLMKEIRFPHSLGLLYSTITAYLGFSVNNSEYKVMGLSAYGETDPEKNRYYRMLKEVVDIADDGSFFMDMDYFKYHYADRMPSDKLCALLGGEPRSPDSELKERHKDIAAAVQIITEEAMTKMITHLYNVTKCDNLVVGGGVALNSVFNGKILGSTPFKRVWIQPAAGDAGASIGVAAYSWFTLLGHKRSSYQKTAYLGPEYSREQVKEFLDSKGISYSEFKSKDELVEKTAKLIFEDNVVGWFQGRMEWGPRALGSRSILSNPCNPKMQEILNLKVKHREKFRPFAPVVTVEDAPTYFECDMPIPEPTDYMLMVYPIKRKWRERIPAVTHVDGSGRLQTVRREQNPMYYDVIRKFGALSGIPILINTSFNIRGEPIVCKPHDAYRCMMGTGIDCLAMSDFLIFRKDNPSHMWDSESTAKD